MGASGQWAGNDDRPFAAGRPEGTAPCPGAWYACAAASGGGGQAGDFPLGQSGGGGLMGEGVCGALTGGRLALGATYGRDRDKLDRGRCINHFKKAKALTESFRAEFGGLTCRDLQQQFTGRTWDNWNAAEDQRLMPRAG